MMFMKNVLFVVIDSVFEEIMDSNPETCPFINSIKDNSLYFSNVYSQGPYTEAGTKGLLCSENTLDNEAYLFRYSKANNFISNIFKDNGYKTSSIIYPTTLYNKKITDKLDNIQFTSVFLPTVFWEQKLEFYKPMWDKNEMSEDDYGKVYELLDDIFYFWEYSVDKKSHPQCFELLSKHEESFPFEQMYDYVICEKAKYESNKKSYVDDLFATNGEALKVDTFAKTNIIKKSVLKEIQKKQRKFCNQIIFKQLCVEIKKIGLLIRTANGQKIQEKVKLLKSWIKGIKRCFDILLIKGDNDYKLLLSANAQLDCVGELLSKKHEEPQFVMVHVEEPHYYNTFFSYDSCNAKQINDEFEYAEKYLKTIKPCSYTGSIYYDLSLRYIDLQLKKLFEKLGSEGILNNTVVILTSDHGSSYAGTTIRSKDVVNFYTENYHIPFIIYDRELSGGKMDKLASNIDIIPTILDYLGIKTPTNIAGKNLLSPFERNHIFIEHVGSGCPDMSHKPVWIAIRNHHYQIGYIGSVFEEFDIDNIDSVYDLQNDHEQMKNIKSGGYNREIKQLIDLIEERFNKLKEQYKESRR